MPEHVACLRNRLHRGEDGLTAYERIKGKKHMCPSIEFGERILFRKHAGNLQEKINSRFEHGVVVGVRKRNNELIVATARKIKFGRSAKRIPFERKTI